SCRVGWLALHVDAEVRADLITEHTADAVFLVGHIHGEPAELVGRGAPGEDIRGADVQTKAARLAHVLANHHIPLAAAPCRRPFLRFEQRHALSSTQGRVTLARSPTVVRCPYREKALPVSWQRCPGRQDNIQT